MLLCIVRTEAWKNIEDKPVQVLLGLKHRVLKCASSLRKHGYIICKFPYYDMGYLILMYYSIVIASRG